MYRFAPSSSTGAASGRGPCKPAPGTGRSRWRRRRIEPVRRRDCPVSRVRGRQRWCRCGCVPPDQSTHGIRPPCSTSLMADSVSVQSTTRACCGGNRTETRFAAPDSWPFVILSPRIGFGASAAIKPCPSTRRSRNEYEVRPVRRAQQTATGTGTAQGALVADGGTRNATEHRRVDSGTSERTRGAQGAAPFRPAA